MAIAFRDLAACFEGVIPSIVATAATDGTPNISYLSHVVLVDDSHIALSNQFFSKTASNVRVNPSAAVLIVDPRDGTQYQLDTSYECSHEAGDLFEDMAVQLRASSAQIGMAQVMRLRSADVYRVDSVCAIASPCSGADPGLDLLVALSSHSANDHVTDFSIRDHTRYMPQPNLAMSQRWVPPIGAENEQVFKSVRSGAM